MATKRKLYKADSGECSTSKRIKCNYCFKLHSMTPDPRGHDPSVVDPEVERATVHSMIPVMTDRSLTPGLPGVNDL